MNKTYTNIDLELKSRSICIKIKIKIRAKLRTAKYHFDFVKTTIQDPTNPELNKIETLPTSTLRKFTEHNKKKTPYCSITD